MKAYCEKKDGTYESVEVGEPECGDFCDGCGDCLKCYGVYDGYCSPCRWVLYYDSEKNPFRKQDESRIQDKE